MEKKKRERGANYTAEEKILLAELVTKNKQIIEDKRTGGILNNKKKEAWREVTLKYNKQLKALYDNMKQKSRKIVAENNMLRKHSKISKKTRYFFSYLHLLIHYYYWVQMNKTGGGFWKPKSTDCDTKILAVIQDQVLRYSDKDLLFNSSQVWQVSTCGRPNFDENSCLKTFL
ncbi:hypothetical protein ABMA27_007805 [Loxostege sticticalis]|uniref:Regulatory protein zeste n=1 Tax=Loxostege sticticalis TaxID=481309 RepID=A0ABR3HCY9_LOXSC